MKEITIYECEDGTRFNNKSKALEYDNLCSDVEKIMSKLESRTKECEDEKCFIQHNPENVKEVLKEFLSLCSRVFPRYEKVFVECTNGTRSMSHALYILDYRDPSILITTMFRLSCINMESGREYNQIYYAHHEDEFKN